jgi:hypothetical protein
LDGLEVWIDPISEEEVGFFISENGENFRQSSRNEIMFIFNLSNKTTIRKYLYYGYQLAILPKPFSLSGIFKNDFFIFYSFTHEGEE